MGYGKKVRQVSLKKEEPNALVSLGSRFKEGSTDSSKRVRREL